MRSVGTTGCRKGRGQGREEEALRVAYVAATRARDLLVVAAIGEEERAGGWLSPLMRRRIRRRSVARGAGARVSPVRRHHRVEPSARQ